MSYEKIKSIKIKNGKVIINCASNNVLPLYYRKEECSYFTKILQEKGLQAVEIEILKTYDSGSFQQGNNKYTKALKVLRYIFSDEYHKFDWRNNWEESKKNKDNKEYDELLLKALNYKMSKQKYVITKEGHNKEWFGKFTTKHMIWKKSVKEATKYDFEKEAEIVKSCFKFSNDWKIVMV
jgi:hypothetical protein